MQMAWSSRTPSSPMRDSDLPVLAVGTWEEVMMMQQCCVQYRLALSTFTELLTVVCMDAVMQCMDLI